MILMRLYISVPILIIAFLSEADGFDSQTKSKRQIYREQVLPSQGGKIPDAAFTSERLALNRLNKEGISVPDGVLLEHRNVHHHPHLNQHDPEKEDALIKIIQKSEDRFVASPGKYFNEKPLTVTSTYLIRKPIGPESTSIKIPVHPTSFRPIDQSHFNQVYNSFPVGYYPHQFVPAKVPLSPHPLPQISTPPHSFLQTRVPVHKYKTVVQVPSNKYLPVSPTPLKYYSTSFKFPPKKKYFTQGYSPTVIRHPHPKGYEAPVSYQSVSYFSPSTPLDFSSKNTLTNNYLHPTGTSSNVFGDVHGVVDWPAFLEQYSQISNKINFVNPSTYSDSSLTNSQFLPPEVLGSISSDPHYIGASSLERYTRKSTDTSAAESKPVSERLKTIKVKCSKGIENTMEGGFAQCYE